MNFNQEKTPESQVWESGAGHESQDTGDTYRMAELLVEDPPLFRETEIELYRLRDFAELLTDRAEAKREDIVYPVSYLHPHDR